MKKITSALVIGVATVAMLALLVAPALAGSASWREGTTQSTWRAWAIANGVWNDNNINVFTSTSQSYDIGGITLTLWYHTGYDTISYAELEGYNAGGLHVHAEAWVSPPGFQYRYGGTWYTF